MESTVKIVIKIVAAIIVVNAVDCFWKKRAAENLNTTFNKCCRQYR